MDSTPCSADCLGRVSWFHQCAKARSQPGMRCSCFRRTRLQTATCETQQTYLDSSMTISRCERKQQQQLPLCGGHVSAMQLPSWLEPPFTASKVLFQHLQLTGAKLNPPCIMHKQQLSELRNRLSLPVNIRPNLHKATAPTTRRLQDFCWLSCSCTLPQANPPLHNPAQHGVMRSAHQSGTVTKWHCAVALLAPACHRACAQVLKPESSASCTVHRTATQLLPLCCGAGLHTCTGAGVASVM